MSCLLAVLFSSLTNAALAQPTGELAGRALYDALKRFELRGKASVSNFALKRDRAEMVFTGDFYFAAPVNGRVTGAVFLGQGTFRAEPPAVPFEKENMSRFLKADVAESDFVKRFENKAASTEDFADVASAHFARTPIARHLGLKDLNWFFQQWVFEAKLPSYRMEYQMEPGQGGQFVIKGKVIQENAGENWLMPLPLVFTFPNNQQGRSLVYVNGTETPFQMSLPMKPSSVELDPDHWILSEKTSTKKQ